jgi:murein DD-endopeptidase MepM/ murein hydrolase activator NlpD
VRYRRQVRRLIVAIGLLAAGVAGVGIGLSRSSAERASCGFDFPVGPPDGAGFDDAQPFGANHHLGNDWARQGGGNTLGLFAFAVADGVVTDAQDYGGGWGNVVRVLHTCGDRVESLYAHLDRVYVIKGTRVVRGQPIGTIGTAGGRYQAHLHFEIRDRVMPLGGGYSTNRSGYLDPAGYIRHHRPAVSE